MAAPKTEFKPIISRATPSLEVATTSNFLAAASATEPSVGFSNAGGGTDKRRLVQLQPSQNPFIPTTTPSLLIDPDRAAQFLHLEHVDLRSRPENNMNRPGRTAPSRSPPSVQPCLLRRALWHRRPTAPAGIVPCPTEPLCGGLP